MSKMRLFICFISIFLISFCDVEAMSRPQLKKTLTVIKKQCMPKIGVSEDKVAKIEQGVFIEDQKVMCYITCVYRTLQVMKNDRLDKGLISKQIDALYPVEMRAIVKKGINKCFDIQYEYTDVCQGVFYSTKCLYEFDPANFVFP